MELRPYQKAAIEKILWARSANIEGNSLLILPTGAGKSIVIAHIAKTLTEPILILQPSKEILEQNLDKLLRYVDRIRIGVYSASMDERTIKEFTFATIQSIYKKPEYFKHFKLVIIDEAHLVNPKNLEGMFTTFLKQIGHPKVIGLTATPYRLDTMYMNWGKDTCRVVSTIKLINRTKGLFWNRILFNINIQELIDQKYLCPLEYIDFSLVNQADIPLNISRSDFDMGAYEGMISDKQKEILKAIEHAKKISKSVLVFCSSVGQATKLSGLVENSSVVSAKTPKKDRADIIADFRSGKTKVIFNMGVLTIGFDHPSLDCIVLLRPTRSIGLFYQMLGRGVRIAEGKTSCKVIDLTSTVKNIGHVESIKLIKREKWELESIADGQTVSWHNRELYDFVFQRKVAGEKAKPVAPKSNSYALRDALNYVNSTETQR